jgi:hypothetical protein
MTFKILQKSPKQGSGCLFHSTKYAFKITDMLSLPHNKYFGVLTNKYPNVL